MIVPAEWRFWTKVLPVDSGCWEWQGHRLPKGYGHFRGLTAKNVKAHRFAYELLVGPIPDGLRVLHRCDNPPCVNPVHLFLGTDKDNSDDKIAKGRYVSWNSLKTHCPQGHEYSEANTKWWGPRGLFRVCRTCHRTRNRQWKRVKTLRAQERRRVAQ